MEKLSLSLSLIYCLLLSVVPTVTAQDAADAETGWPIEQQCVDEPTMPPEGWTFEGTIFTLGDYGVHAIRADIATPYYVAFSGDTVFPNIGALSPDGRWFAVPAGQTGYGPGGSSIFDISEIRVYSTDGRRELHRVWGVGKVTEGISAYYAVTSPQWIDNEHLLYYSSDDPWQILVINPFTQEAAQWQGDKINPLFTIPSPDRTRAIYPALGQSIDTVEWGLYDFPREQLIAPLPSLVYDAITSPVDWAPDSSSFAALIENPREENTPYSGALVLFDRNGEQTDVLTQLFPQFTQDAPTLRFSPDGRYLAFSRFRETDLLMADISNRHITAKCLNEDVYGLAWSPDGHQLAFTYNGNVVILDLESNELYTAAYNIGAVLDWKSRD